MRLAVSISEAASSVGVSRSTLYLAIKKGHLQKKKIGRRTVILVSDLENWLRGLPNERQTTGK